MLKIRLRRIGKKRTPYYRVVVAEKEAKRDGAFLETLGSYDPHANPPSAVIDADKTREWIRKGAQPSEAAVKVLRRVGILEAPVVEAKVESPKAKSKQAAGKQAAVKSAEKAPAAAKSPKAEAAAVAVAEAAPEAGEPAAEDVVEAAVEGTPVDEAAQEPGDDTAAEEPPTAE